MLEKGKIIKDTYSIIKLLEKNSMGNVYLVERLEDHKELVLKELIFYSQTDLAIETSREIFFGEAKFMEKFDHPGLPKMYGTFSQNEREYLVMDYIEGESLEKILNSSKIEEDQAILWAIELAGILDYLHNSFHAPIVYRDMKPSNIIITPEGKIKLVDFGIARYYNPEKDSDTFSYGTPGYGAPEQYKGKGQSTPQTDVFGLGVILFQMLTGYNPTLKPFKFPPMKKLNRSIPEELENIVTKAIQLTPPKRYTTISEFKGKLEKYMEDKKNRPSGSFLKKIKSIFRA